MMIRLFPARSSNNYTIFYNNHRTSTEQSEINFSNIIKQEKEDKDI